MPNIKIRGHNADIDVEAELREYDWIRPRWTGDKLIAASPFRYDKTPSFFVSLAGDYVGCWSDAGAYDAEWSSGNFTKLLSFLRNETYEETEDYLLATYVVEWNGGNLTLDVPDLQIAKPERHLAEETLADFQYRHPYLERRGIPEKIQRLYGVGYDRTRQAIVIPWRDSRGRLANVKYRLTRGKVFWYEKGAVPIRESIFGIDIVHQRRIRTAALAEAEIDGMSWAAVGVFGLAAGGANFTDRQADIIAASPIERLLIAGDNDKAGRKFTEQVRAKLAGRVALEVVDWAGESVKDANEALVAGRLSEVGRRDANVFSTGMLKLR